MNAWLLTWVATAVKPRETVVGILSGRRSDRSIAELMEFLVLRARSDAEFAAYCANRHSALVHKAQLTVVINDVPHGDRIWCGHDPWLYGRKVQKLKITVDRSTQEEVLTWQEPNEFRFVAGSHTKIEIAKQGKLEILRRMKGKPLSLDIYEHYGAEA